MDSNAPSNEDEIIRKGFHKKLSYTSLWTRVVNRSILKAIIKQIWRVIQEAKGLTYIPSSVR